MPFSSCSEGQHEKCTTSLCNCRDAGELKFAEMNGSVVVGMSIQVKGSGRKRSNSHFGSFFIFAVIQNALRTFLVKVIARTLMVSN